MNKKTEKSPLAQESSGLAAFSPAPWLQLPDLGLYMDQVITYIEQQCRPLYRQKPFLTAAMVNNYVKSGLLLRPDGKKYGRAQLAQLLMICTLKQALSLEEMKKLLTRPDEAAIQALYADFCRIRAGVWVKILSCSPESSPLDYAIEAAANRILCVEKLTAASDTATGPADPANR
jgi:DNA-binding transcriptional MerR regulator